MKVHHYTTIDTLELILMNRTIRLNRLDYVDDKQESELIAHRHWAKFIFVSSWTANEHESRSMWDYSGLNGVMISLPKFPFKKYQLNSKQEMMLSVGDGTSSPVPFERMYNKKWMFVIPPLIEEIYGNNVEYDPDPTRLVGVHRIDENDDHHFSLGKELARIKDSAWKYQEEYRYVFVIVPIDAEAFQKWQNTGNSEEFFRSGLTNFIRGSDTTLDYFDVELDDSLESIHVTFGPQCSTNEKKRVENLIAQYASAGTTSESRLTGKLQEPKRS